MNSNTNFTRRVLTACLMFGVMLSLGATAQAQLLTDDFSYTASTDLTANGWTGHSSAGTNPQKVAALGLSYSNYLGNGVGNAAIVNNVSGEDVNRTFTSQTTGSVYVGAMVRIDSAGTGDYFFHVGPNGSTSQFTGKVFVRKNSNGNFQFGVSKAQNFSPVPGTLSMTDSIYTFGTTYFIVLKYKIVTGASNDTTYLFINPTMGGAEPTPTLTCNDPTGSDFGLGANIGGVYLRQSSVAAGPEVVVDGIRVGTTWTDVTPALPSNQYRSFTSGDWNAIGTWEVSTNGGGSWAAAAATPTSADDIVTILATHTVTVTASVSVDQVTVATGGTLHVNSGNTLTVDNGTGTDVTVNGTLSTAGTVSVAASAVVAVNGGSFQINEGGWGGNTGSYTYDATGTLVFNNTSGFYGVDGTSAFFPSPITNVTVQNTGGLQLNGTKTVTGLFQTATGVKNSFGNDLIASGTVQLNPNGYFDNFSPTYSGTGSLVYNTGGLYGIYNEWTGAGASVGYGTPHNVTLQATSVALANTNRRAAGSVILTGASTLTFSIVSGDLKIGANLDRGVGSSLVTNGRTIFFDGTSAGAITAAGGITLDYVIVDKSSAALTLNNDLTINQNLNVLTGTVSTGANKVILASGGSLTEAGSGTIVLGNVEASRTISSNGSNQTFGGIGMELNAVTGPVPGATTVTRVTGTAQTGSGNQSIKRYYDISADTTTGLNATMVFHYDDAAAEMNTNVENTLSLYRSTNSGSTWLTNGTPTRDTVNNKLTLAGVANFSRWTAADATHPLVTAASMTSDIIAVGSSESATISSIINTSGPLTSSQGTQVWQFTIRDGGTSSPDADALTTEVIAMILSPGTGNTITDWSNAINAVDLFDGATHVASGTVFATSIQFNTMSAVAPDNGSKTLSLRLTLKDPLGSGVADNQRFVFEISSGLVVSNGSGSLFGGFPNATSSASANAIDVAGTELNFTTQPLNNQGLNANIAPVAVTARDSNGNTDADFANAVTLSSGTFTLASTDPGGLTKTPTSGVASWSNLSSSTSGTASVLANATGVSQGISNAITVLSNVVTSAASGSWNVGTTWVGGLAPLASQSVVIANGHTVTLTATDTCAAVTVNSGGILEIGTFQLRLAGTYTISAGGEGRQNAFNPVPGGGATPWAFDPASTYTIGGAATGFSIGSQPGITFGNMNWASSANGTPPVGVVIAGNLVKSGAGQMRGGTGSTSRVVTVNGNVTVNGGILYGTNSTSPATGGFNIGGDLTINPGGTLGFNLFSGASTIQVGGNVIVNDTGKVITGAGSGSGTLYFKGSATSNFDPGIFAANTFKNIGIPAGRTVNMINHDVTIASTWTLSDSGTLNLGTNVVKGAGAFQNISGSTLGIGSADGITTGATGNVQVTGTRTFAAGATYVYNGAVPQSTGDGLPATLSNLTIGNSTGVTLTQSTTVSSTLDLGANKLSTGANVVTIGSSGLLTRTTGYVIGNLQRTLVVALTSATVASAASANFEIGDASAYAPVYIEGTSFSGDFSVTASTSPGDHVDITNSGIDGAKSVNRSYTLIGSPTGPTDVTFNFDAADVDGGANTTNFIVGKYDSPNWTLPAVGVKTATSTQATGITTFSEFAIGEAAVITPDVTWGANMKVQMQAGLFRPDLGDAVLVRGAFNGWGTADTLVDGDSDSIYTKTVAVTANSSGGYKFFKTLRGGSDWESGSDRSFSVGVNDTSYTRYFNDHDVAATVTFQLDLKAHALESSFVPGTDVVTVRGSFNDWGNSTNNPDTLTDGDVDSVYTHTRLIATSAAATVDYKFWTSGALGYEGISNRQLMTPGDTVLSVVCFNNDCVANIPGFLVAPSSIAFGTSVIGDSLTDTVYVYNTGASTLNVTSIISDNSVFAVTPSSGTLAAGESLAVAVTFTPDSAQAESGSIIFTHDASGSPDTVSVTGTGMNLVPAYFLSLSPDSVFNEDPAKPNKSKKIVKRNKGLYPNWSNLLDEVNAQGGFAPGTTESDSAGGMVIGKSYMFNAGGPGPAAKWKAVKDSAKIHPWVRLAKWDFKKNIGKSFANIQKTLNDKGLKHTGSASGIDTTTDGKNKPIYKQLTKLSPKKHSNKLFAELVALKVNIAASAMGKTPAGLGDLIFDTDGNFLDEMTIIQIADTADQMMTLWQGHTQEEYDSLYSAVYNINRAFIGALDTITFNTPDSLHPKGKMTLAGAVDVNTVSYLKVPSPFVATRTYALNPEVESPEDWEEEEAIDEDGATPVAAKLYQNYPNPFNPSTVISFRLLETSQVTIRVYNMLGQEIATLLSGEEMDEGLQEVQFSAGGISSGVYFYRIEAQGQDDAGLKTVETRKMVLLK